VSSLATKPGQRKLSEVARHVVIPSGIATTGWPAVRDRLTMFGIPFDMWQEGAARLILAKRPDGMYAAGVGGVIISIPRQVGKTYLVGWICFALCTLYPRLTVIWTAHHGRTTGETFGKMRAMARRPEVAPYVETVRAANGEQAVLFKNESRILFGSRDQGFGLGFDKVDILVLDEGQRVKEVAMADMVPATNAAPNGLVFLMGTPPRPTDNGDVFSARRNDALDGDQDTLYIELSADQNAKIVDWEQVAKANPSYPHRTTKTAILRMQKMLGSDEGFYREGYGIWDDLHGARRAISEIDWDALGVSEAPEAGIRSFGVSFSVSGARASLAGSVKHSNGVHVELIDAMSGDIEHGVDAVATWLAERWRQVAQIAISGQSWAAALEQQLLDRGVPQTVIHVLSSTEVFASSAMFLDTVLDSAKAAREGHAPSLTHPIGHLTDHLEASVAVCDKKTRIKTSGAWAWEATTADGDETPIEAVSFAHWASRTSKRDPNRKQVLI
jgi:hypothetical protein